MCRQSATPHPRRRRRSRVKVRSDAAGGDLAAGRPGGDVLLDAAQDGGMPAVPVTRDGQGVDDSLPVGDQAEQVAGVLVEADGERALAAAAGDPQSAGALKPDLRLLHVVDQPEPLAGAAAPLEAGVTDRAAPQ